MRRFSLSYCSLMLCAALLVATRTTAQPTVPSIPNAGFEEKTNDGRASSWAASSVAGRPSGVVGTDAAIRHGGSASLKIVNDRPVSTTVVSGPLHLEVGHPYRLRCWIKTEHALTDSSARYPTPVAATISMQSFPFTNCAPPVGGSSGWTATEVRFFATQATDRVVLTLGFNGVATGTAWFDDLSIEPVTDISTMIPMETVRWFGPAFRYTDGGWTFVHIEGAPYQRGYQYGSLLAKELVSYIEKLAVRANSDAPRQGWSDTRLLADALMFRKYDPEYLEEMKGIADGAAAAGAQVYGRSPDVLDVVTVNSAVDLGQMGSALARTATPLTGRSFNAEEQELQVAERLHKCSSFLANGPATPDGSIVFGQLFMWGGYTGVHWDVICDVKPEKGHRLVYQTFPGGIHSGSDFYINDAGIMIGETTVMQTPFNAAGTPQSSRIRKAAQYAESIDDVVRILTTQNNGLYTNDWLIGDANTNETAILLLGTQRWKLWRSSQKDLPGGTEGFLWSVNNAKDPEVRKEYAPDPSNAPFDLIFSPSNRDIAFLDFYRNSKGSITGPAGMKALATSPLNRPHACDGKVTTTDMARHLMLNAHYGKVTLREKFPEKNSRLMPDLPGAQPHLTLGYTTFSPLVVAEELQKRHHDAAATPAKSPDNLKNVAETYAYPKKLLWMNTVYPAREADNWFVSATAAYWNMLNGLPSGQQAAMNALRDQLGEMNARLQFTMAREGRLVPLKTSRQYGSTKEYLIPRLRGTFLLHQLRLALGNETFSALMNDVHTRFRERPMSTADFIAAAERAAGRTLRPMIMQWLERDDVPSCTVTSSVEPDGNHWVVRLHVKQEGRPYTFMASVAVDTTGGVAWIPVTVDGPSYSTALSFTRQPRSVVFNAGADAPLAVSRYYTFSNFFDNYAATRIVYGTRRQVEAQHTMALRLQTTLADLFTETLTPLRKDSEIDSSELASSDLIVLGGAADNTLAGALASAVSAGTIPGVFQWHGAAYGEPDDGIFLALPSPWNPQRAVYWFNSNSALELYAMTRRPAGLPAWARFKGEQILERGYLAE